MALWSLSSSSPAFFLRLRLRSRRLVVIRPSTLSQHQTPLEPPISFVHHSFLLRFHIWFLCVDSGLLSPAQAPDISSLKPSTEFPLPTYHVRQYQVPSCLPLVQVPLPFPQTVSLYLAVFAQWRRVGGRVTSTFGAPYLIVAEKFVLL